MKTTEDIAFWLLHNYMEGDGRMKTKDVFNHYVCAEAEEEKHAYAFRAVLRRLFPNVRMSSAQLMINGPDGARKSSERIYVGLVKRDPPSTNAATEDVFTRNGWISVANETAKATASKMDSFEDNTAVLDVKMLLHSVENLIMEGEDKNTEVDHIKKVLKANGYKTGCLTPRNQREGRRTLPQKPAEDNMP
ncbi:hypothetical protein LSAT2_027512 [Lamellibrachia satsuma]|nr:hypothetical protein LSAT2_027512 [Lamellibrachia satsuma]